ncbi:MAG: hypothetical protein K6L73_08335 [Cellvibrionaceae bacterium]
MKIITTILFFTGVSLAMFVSSQNMYGSACDVERSRHLHFSDTSSLDSMSVSIAGATCEKARIHIALRNSDNDLIYSYQGNFSEHFPFELEGDALATAAAPFAESLLEDANIRSTQALPELTSADAYLQENNESLMISSEDYQALQRNERPIIRHATANGSWLNLVYNAESKSATPILQGGPSEVPTIN